MMIIGWQTVTALRALVEVAWMFLLAQGVLLVLAGQGRENNFVYRLFRAITRPVILAMRFLTPRAMGLFPPRALCFSYFPFLSLTVSSRTGHHDDRRFAPDLFPIMAFIFWIISYYEHMSWYFVLTHAFNKET